MSPLPSTRHLTIDRVGHAVVLAPDVSLTGDPDTEELLSVLGALEAEGAPFVVLDLAKVEFINSLALGVILSGHVRLSRRGSRLLLCNVGERVRKVFFITKLEPILVVHGSLESALAACAP
jgi:anti-anti-sigma factor